MKFVITPLIHILSHADILFGFDIITASQPVDANVTNHVPNLFGEFIEECSIMRAQTRFACHNYLQCFESQLFLVQEIIKT